MKQSICILTLLVFALAGCSKKQQQPINITAEDYHNAVDKLSDIMVHDIFSPPVASRIYAYTNIASYETLAANNDQLRSLSANYPDLKTIPKADTVQKVNYRLASLIAQMEVGKQLIFSEEVLESYRDSLFGIWEKENTTEFEVSRDYGLQVANHLKPWINSDNYKETRTMPKYSVYSDDPSRWQPTPPSYMAGIEPHWAKIRPFTLDSAAQFKPEKHPEFSMENGSDFYAETMEVYKVRKEINKLGDDSEEIQIARFWDCNPYVSTQRGHLMFATKKITPGGHWIGITKIASRKKKLDFEETVFSYTATSVAMADAFISCWDEKYRSELIRPETLINQEIDENWKPILQTPPFPEYPSGHSVVSGAAAAVLTQLFGDGFEYIDDTEVKYGLPKRSFTSFNQAAEEAAISRLYGGIHYRSAIDNGLIQGRNIGAHVVEQLQLESVIR